MRTVILDSQILSSLQRCAARTNFYFKEDLRSIGTQAALQKGILIHQFFAAYYGRRKESGNVAEWIDCAHVGLEHIKPLEAGSGLMEQDIASVTRALGQYVEHYKHEPMEVLNVEEPFAITLYENEEEDLRIVYVGVIDLICKLLDGNERVFDHKSQSRRSDFILLDDQFEGYATATSTNILTVNVIGLQASVPFEEKSRRIPLSYTPFLLERWKQHVIYWVKQYIVYDVNHEWPENHQGCNKFALCEFYSVCTSSSDAARAWKLKSDFVVGEKWDPTKVLENRS